MSAWEIVLLVVVCVAFAIALGVIIYNKIKGKNSCGCDGCLSCGGKCPHCNAAKNDKPIKPQSKK